MHPPAMPRAVGTTHHSSLVAVDPVVRGGAVVCERAASAPRTTLSHSAPLTDTSGPVSLT
eukprot:765269-Prymnesium_polylepis.1